MNYHGTFKNHVGIYTKNIVYREVLKTDKLLELKKISQFKFNDHLNRFFVY